MTDPSTETVATKARCIAARPLRETPGWI